MKTILSILAFAAVALGQQVTIDRARLRGERIYRAEFKMPVNEWRGTTDSSWETVTNWSLAAIPVAGDTVVISEDALRPLLTDLDRTGDSLGIGLDLTALIVRPGAPVVGSSGERLKLTSRLVEYRGNSDFYFNAAGLTATDRLILAGEGFSDIVDTIGISQFEILSGGADIAIANPVYMYVDSDRPQKADVTITSSQINTSPGIIILQRSGTIHWEADGFVDGQVQAFLAGGVFSYDAGELGSGSSGTKQGEIHLMGGVFDWKHTGQVGQIRALNGVLYGHSTPGLKTVGGSVVRSENVIWNVDPKMFTITGTETIIGQ